MTSILSSLLFFRQIETSAEALHTSSSIKNSLLSGKEWVTIRTDINLQQRLDAECLKAISTGTTYRGFDIFWMYSFFHNNPRVTLIRTIAKRLHYMLTVVFGSKFISNGCEHDCTWTRLFRQVSRPGITVKTRLDLAFDRSPY